MKGEEKRPQKEEEKRKGGKLGSDKLWVAFQGEK